MKMKNKLQNNLEDEIDLIKLLRKIWKSKLKIVKWTIYFSLIGLLISIISPKKFTASSTFIPQTSESNTGTNISGLASLAGINISSSSTGGEIPPSLYPQILNSVPVKRLILNSIIPSDSIELSYSDYLLNKPLPIINLIKKYTIGLPSVIFNSYKKQILF